MRAELETPAMLLAIDDDSYVGNESLFVHDSLSRKQEVALL